MTTSFQAQVEAEKAQRDHDRSMIDFCLRYPNVIDDWEQNFAKSLAAWMDKGSDLTIRQWERLVELVDKVETATGATV